jgi:undecaprenyl-diphosphatase
MNTLAIFCAKYLYLASAVVAGLYWLRTEAQVRKRLFWFAAMSLPIALVIAKIANRLYDNPRPFVAGGFEPLIAHAPDNGFPSDHTLLAASLASVVMFFNKRLGFALWAIALAVAWGRVLTGVHHWLDVAASIVISLLAAAMVYLSGKFKNNHEPYR